MYFLYYCILIVLNRHHQQIFLYFLSCNRSHHTMFYLFTILHHLCFTISTTHCIVGQQLIAMVSNQVEKGVPQGSIRGPAVRTVRVSESVSCVGCSPSCSAPQKFIVYICVWLSDFLVFLTRPKNTNININLGLCEHKTEMTKLDFAFWGPIGIPAMAMSWVHQF